MSRLSFVILGLIATNGLFAAAPDPQGLRIDQGLDWDYCKTEVCTRSKGAGCAGAAVTKATRDWLPIPPGQPDFVYMQADSMLLERDKDQLILSGDAALRQDETFLETDQLIYHKNSEIADLQGDIYLQLPGLRLTGEEGRIWLNEDRGWLSGVEYRLPDAHARGLAERMEMVSETESKYEQVSITTCRPGTRDWGLHASSMQIDTDSGWGKARHTVLRLGGLPVFYTPYLSFPVDDRRKSGFLIPIWGSSLQLGAVVAIPYYVNLAPNYDATITPRYMSKRGTMLDGEFRYLGEHQKGIVSGEILKDKVESEEHGSQRDSIRILHNSQPMPGLSTRIDYSRVSDIDYVNDFSTDLSSSSIRYLQRIGEILYRGSDWRLGARVQDFQTVDRSINPVDEPYRLKPQLTASYKHLFSDISTELGLASEYASFSHDELLNGKRLRLNPSLSFPLRRSWGHLIPKLSLYHTSYNLNQDDSEAEENPSVNVPVLSLDTGLVFERTSSWFGNTTTQTLEPRLFGLYAPYEDQSDIPDFDTSDLDLNYTNLFKENRFSGGDRVGDAKQVTLALTTRWLERDSGIERLRASIGQIFYGQDREVQLIDEPETDSTSAVAAEARARLGSYWSSSMNLRWDPHRDEQQIDKGRIGLHYKAPNQRLLNISYNYNYDDDDKNKIKDLDLSLNWPFDHRITLVGDWKHSLVHKRDLNRLIGFEYGGRCCWSLRALYQEFVKETDLDADINQESETRFMLQLELRGLGSLGKDIQQVKEDSIYGYQAE